MVFLPLHREQCCAVSRKHQRLRPGETQRHTWVNEGNLSLHRPFSHHCGMWSCFTTQTRAMCSSQSSALMKQWPTFCFNEGVSGHKYCCYKALSRENTELYLWDVCMKTEVNLGLLYITLKYVQMRRSVMVWSVLVEAYYTLDICVIDIYRYKVVAMKNMFAYSCCFCFFMQLPEFKKTQ